MNSCPKPDTFHILGSQYKLAFALSRCLTVLTFTHLNNLCSYTGITCPKIDAPDYGTVKVSDSTYGSRAVYVCNRGYELYGENYRTCEYNGKWGGKAPVCKRKN